MDSHNEINMIDKDMETLIDNAIERADEFAMESAKEFQVLNGNIKEVIEDSERSLRAGKKVKTNIGMSLIFVSEEAIEHLKYVQNLREFLQEEAKKMIKDIMAKRNAKKTSEEGKKAGKSGKKRARKNCEST